MRTGNFINQLQGKAQYKAFIPNNLPFEIKFDTTLQNLLSHADQALGRLDGTADIIPDLDFFILMYVRKEATVSSQIEGTQATFVDLLKKEARFDDAGMHNDVDEVVNYIDAMNYGLERLKNFPLSLRLLREIHKKLLVDVRGESKTPGEFRSSQNWIGGPTIETAAYIPPPAGQVLDIIGNLENYIHSNDSLPVLIKAGLLHAQFESIHPFLDGNGRTGRLLITFYLCQQAVLHRPLLYLSDFFNTHRQTYYDKLNKYRIHDDIEGWLKFFLEGIIETSEAAVSTARKIIILRNDGLHKVAGFGRNIENAMKLYNHLFRTPMIRIKDVENLLNIKNPNALLLVRKFLDSGLLQEQTGYRRNRVFSFSEYIKLFE